MRWYNLGIHRELVNASVTLQEIKNPVGRRTWGPSGDHYAVSRRALYPFLRTEPCDTALRSEARVADRDGLRAGHILADDWEFRPGDPPKVFGHRLGGESLRRGRVGTHYHDIVAPAAFSQHEFFTRRRAHRPASDLIRCGPR